MEESLRSNWAVVLAAAFVFIALTVMVVFEKHLVESVPVRSLDPAIFPNLYQVAVSAILDQSAFYSGWSVGLIVAAWYVMVHGLEKIPHQILSIGFVLVCGLSLSSLCLGQMLNQVVIGSIAIGQDPLFNPKSSLFLSYQYWTVITAALGVAGAVVGRVVLA